jgi:hypothetical protein
MNSACNSGSRAKGVGISRLDTEVVGSNPAQGMDICPHLTVLCKHVEVEALRRADPPFRESYQMWNWFIISKVILN